MDIYLIGIPCMRKPGSTKQTKHERWRAFGERTHSKFFYGARKDRNGTHGTRSYATNGDIYTTDGYKLQGAERSDGEDRPI